MTVRAFAEHHSISLQWARKHKRENSPEWKQFNAHRTDAPLPAPPPVTVFRQPMDEVTRAEEAKELAWRIFKRAADAAEQGGATVVEQAALNRAAKEAREQYERASKHHANSLIEAGKWLPAECLIEIRQAICGGLADVVQNWEVTLAGFMPDDMRPALQSAFDKSRPAWNDGVRGVEKRIQAISPVPC